LTHPSSGFRIRPIGSSFSAEVLGLDLRVPLTPAQISAVQAAFEQHHVLAFRDQALDKAAQLAFTLQFGDLDVHAAMNAGDDVPEVHTVSNLDQHGNPQARRLGSQHWHSDKSYRQIPSVATFLHAVQVPASGGDTCFADTATALEALPLARQEYLASLKIVHSWERSVAKQGGQVSAAEKHQYPPIAHPLARLQPSGRRALYMGQHASHIDGMDIAAGEALIAELHAHCTQSQFVYQHAWRPGDLLMWDNRGLLHRALANFDADANARILHRTVTRGTEVPC
jgi:taurine dioxygenase